MRGLCVLLAPPDAGPKLIARAAAALERRGMELFAERVLDGVPQARFAPQGTRVLICFDPLIRADDPPGEEFDHAAIDSAAYFLGAMLGAATQGMKIANSARQAVNIAEAVLNSQEYNQLRDRITLRRSQMETVEPVLAVLSRHRHRAKVELVDWQGDKAIKKTFRATAGRALANEIAFHDDIAPLSPVPARILHRTANALYFEYISSRHAETILPSVPLPRLLGMKCLAELADFVRLVTARGWDPLDLTPRDNVLIESKSGALRCIDFEFSRRASKLRKPENAAFLSGIRDDDSAAEFFDAGMRQDPYPGKWRPFTGLDRNSFLYDPPAIQKAKRACLHPAWLAWRALGSPSRRRAHIRHRTAILKALATQDQMS